MIFPWILLIVLNGDVLPWAGFQTKEDCENVRSHLAALPKNSKTVCTQGDRT
jgi:hypothetical protein